MADPGNAQQKIGRFACARNSTWPGRTRVLEAIERAGRRVLDFASEVRPRENIGCQNEQISIAAVAVTEREIAGSGRGLP
jgi:hypothetical protein